MTMQATAWATALRNVSPLAKLVAIALSDNDHDGGHVSIEISYLCDYCGVSKEAIFEALGEISEIAWHDEGDRIECDLLTIKTVKETERERRPAPDGSPCEIYVMAVKDSIKIGISHNPQRRREELQIAAMQDVRLVWTAQRMPRFLARKVEVAAHARLEKFCVGGEWFSVSALVAIDVVRAEMELHGLIP
jgi:hypothetical protein